jgi:hypothetical protein
MRTVKQMSKAQLASYRRLRDKGLTISEARRVACMPYAKLVSEVHRKLSQLAQKSGEAGK